MIVQELIGGQAVSVEPTATLRDAVKQMTGSEVGALVVQKDSQIVGIITERDILGACAEDVDLAAVPVADWMTRDPDSLGPEMTVAAAADWMLAAGYRHLPVVDGTEIMGMVSIKDILWGLTEPTSV